jgi:molecular chaperone DnaJ
MICEDCLGHGKTIEKLCNVCNGNGTVASDKTIKIVVPHGILHGEHINLSKKGHTGDGHTGDLYIFIQVIKSKDFDIGNKHSLISEIKVPYEKLMVGGNLKFKTIDGSSVMVSVPKMSKLGSRLKLTGKGLKFRGSESRGDQYLIVNIEIPNTISEDEEELLNKIKKNKE